MTEHAPTPLDAVDVRQWLGIKLSPLLNIENTPSGPTVHVDARASIYVEGTSYWMWDGFGIKVTGGEIVTPLRRYLIADLIRAAVPAESPQWATREQMEAAFGTRLKIGASMFAQHIMDAVHEVDERRAR